MSLYNTVNGVNPATFLFLPMLGQHPDMYPRFRDCFLKDEEHPEYDNHVHVYTRVGGGNRNGYEDEIEQLRSHENYVTDFDDSFDCTYATFVFSVPEQWQADYDALLSGDLTAVSDTYVSHVKSIYPKIAEQLEAAFRPNSDA